MGQVIRFLRRARPAQSGCWEWTGCRLPDGYGRASAGYKQTGLAHRVAWTLFVGPIPEGMYVCHKCDNRSCVKPSHLFLGTQLDNMRDAVAKGRMARNKQPQRPANSKQARHRQERRRYGLCAYEGCEVVTGENYRCEKHAAAFAEYNRRARQKRKLSRERS